MIIIDSSVIFKWFNATEEFHLQAKALLKQHLLKNNEILIPTLLLYEITNAWATKTKLDEKDIKDKLKRLEKYSLKMIPINFTLLKTAAGFSKKYRVSVYDATYAVIAEEKKCDLITADDKFADKINLQFVKKLSTIPNTDIIHLDPA